jgi:hypothetical protein
MLSSRRERMTTLLFGTVVRFKQPTKQFTPPFVQLVKKVLIELGHPKILEFTQGLLIFVTRENAVLFKKKLQSVKLYRKAVDSFEDVGQWAPKIIPFGHGLSPQ